MVMVLVFMLILAIALQMSGLDRIALFQCVLESILHHHLFVAPMGHVFMLIHVLAKQINGLDLNANYQYATVLTVLHQVFV